MARLLTEYRIDQASGCLDGARKDAGLSYDELSRAPFAAGGVSTWTSTLSSPVIDDDGDRSANAPNQRFPSRTASFSLRARSGRS